MHGMTEQELAALELPMDLYEQWRQLRDEVFHSLEDSPELEALEDLDLADDEFIDRLMVLLDRETLKQVCAN